MAVSPYSGYVLCKDRIFSVSPSGALETKVLLTEDFAEGALFGNAYAWLQAPLIEVAP
jgi:hypothetical protein